MEYLGYINFVLGIKDREIKDSIIGFEVKI